MTMQLFPAKLLPADYSPSLDWQVQGEDGRGMLIELMETLPSAYWTARATWVLSTADLATLEAFWLARRAVEAFWFHEYKWRVLTGLAGGAGDGSNRVFPIACSLPDTTLYTPAAYVAAAAKTLNTDFVVGHENRCLRSEDLSVTGTWAVVSGASVTRTAAIADPLGGTKAWRIETTGGSGTDKLRQAISGAASSGRLVRTVVWVKNISTSKAVTVRDELGSTQTVAAGGASAPWVQVILHTVSAGAASAVTFAAPSAGDSLDFYVWRPQVMYEHAQMGLPEDRWGYVPTGTTAITMDSRGRACVVFFPAAAAPGAGEAVTADVSARALRSARFDPYSPWDSVEDDHNQHTVELQLRAATEE